MRTTLLGIVSVAMAAMSIGAAEPQTHRVLDQREDRLIVMLPNRLIVAAQAVRSAPVVSVQAFVKTGSIYEQQHVGAGLSHFLEHLVAGGSTTTRSEEQTNAILGRIGARTNASTSLDTVRYYIQTTSDHTATAVELLSDWLMNSTIRPEEFDRERQVIQSEFAMGRGEPGRILWKLTQQARFRLHPAGHPTIGYLDEFLSVDRQEVIDFYKKMYAPNNIVFVVAGDIDPSAVVAQTAKLWSSAAAAPLPELTFPREAPVESPVELMGSADVRRPRLRLAWQGTRLAEEGDYALDLLATVLGQGESSRLVREVRDRQRLVASVQAYNLSFNWGQGFFAIDADVMVSPAAAPRPDQQPDQASAGLPVAALLQTREAILREIKRVREEGISQEELSRAKRQTIARLVFESQTAEDLAQRLGSDLIASADPDYAARYARTIQTLTREQVMAAADRFLSEKSVIAVSLLPLLPGESAAELKRPDPPTQPAPATDTVDLDNIRIADRMSLQARSSDPDRRALEITPPQRFVLPNGLRVVIGRSTVTPAVAMHVYQLGGTLSDDPTLPGLAQAMSQMRLRGAGGLSSDQIAQRLDALGATLTAQSGNNSFFAQALSLSEDWRAVLDLLADVWLQPTFAPEEWAKLQPRLLAAVERQSENWSGELRAAFLKQYFGDHPWSRTPAGEARAIERITVEDLRRFHRAGLGASDTVIAVFGDVTVKEVLEHVDRRWGDMPAVAERPFDPSIPASPRASLEQVTTNKGLAAVQVGLGPGVSRAGPDYAALNVLANTLSSFPAGWLEGELRGRGEGLVYAVSAGQVAGVVPGYFYAIFNTQPMSAVEALARTMAVLDRARQEPVDQATLERAKAATVTEEVLGKQSLDERAAEAALAWMYDLPEDSTRRFMQDVEQVTPELLQVVAQTYLRNPVVTVLTHQPLPADELRKAYEAKYIVVQP